MLAILCIALAPAVVWGLRVDDADLPIEEEDQAVAPQEEQATLTLTPQTSPNCTTYFSLDAARAAKEAADAQLSKKAANLPTKKDEAQSDVKKAQDDYAVATKNAGQLESAAGELKTVIDNLWKKAQKDEASAKERAESCAGKFIDLEPARREVARTKTVKVSADEKAKESKEEEVATVQAAQKAKEVAEEAVKKYSSIIKEAKVEASRDEKEVENATSTKEEREEVAKGMQRNFKAVEAAANATVVMANLKFTAEETIRATNNKVANKKTNNSNRMAKTMAKIKEEVKDTSQQAASEKDHQVDAGMTEHELAKHVEETGKEEEQSVENAAEKKDDERKLVVESGERSVQDKKAKTDVEKEAAREISEAKAECKVAIKVAQDAEVNEEEKIALKAQKARERAEMLNKVHKETKSLQELEAIAAKKVPEAHARLQKALEEMEKAKKKLLLAQQELDRLMKLMAFWKSTGKAVSKVKLMQAEAKKELAQKEITILKKQLGHMEKSVIATKAKALEDKGLSETIGKAKAELAIAEKAYANTSAKYADEVYQTLQRAEAANATAAKEDDEIAYEDADDLEDDDDDGSGSGSGGKGRG